MAKKEEPKEVKETKPEVHKKEAPKKDVKEAPVEVKKEKKSEKKPEGKGEGKGEGKEHAKKERKGAPKEVKKESPKPKDAGQEEIRHIVRIAETDLNGNRGVHYALTGIKGISTRVARILCDNAGIDPKATLGYLKDAEIEQLQSSVDNVMTIVPHWMMNKQNDTMSGEDKHVIGTDVLLSLMEDLNLMKKMRSYKGVRHDRGLRVRGQRTRSTGRKGRVVGVSRTALAAAKAPAEGAKKEEAKGAGK